MQTKDCNFKFKLLFILYLSTLFTIENSYNSFKYLLNKENNVMFFFQK